MKLLWIVCAMASFDHVSRLSFGHEEHLKVTIL